MHAAELDKVELDEELCAASERRSSWPGRCSRGAAERSCRRPEATSSGAGGSTRTSTRSRCSAPRCTSTGATTCAPTSLTGAHIFLDEASVMATENVVMAAVRATGRDDDRQRGLRAARPGSVPLPRCARSARSTASGRTSCTSKGVERLDGGEYRIGPDHIEVASFIGLAAVTGGDLMIEDVHAEDLVADPAGPSSASESTSRSRGTPCACPPARNSSIRDDLGGQIPKIEDGPWPAFPADLTSIALTVATQARGTVLIFEKMFENRLFFVDKLVIDGCADHPLRSASRSRQRAGDVSTASAWRARTSAPEWRC